MPVQAQTSASWNVDASGTYSDPANWSPMTPPDGGGIATFGIAPGLSGGRSVSIDTNATLSGVTLNSPFRYRAGHVSLTTSISLVAGSDFTLHVPDSGGITFYTSERFSHLFSGGFTGSANAFVKTGAGPVDLGDSGNGFTAPVFIRGGEVCVHTKLGVSQLGSNPAPLDGGILRYYGSLLSFVTISRPFTIGPNGGTLRTDTRAIRYV